MATFNYESDLSAVGDGHAEKVHVTIDIVANARRVRTAESVFDVSHVGMGIAVPSLAGGPPPTQPTVSLRTIVTVNSATEIIVDTDLLVSIAGTEHILMWGTDNAPAMAAFIVAHPSGTHTINLTAGHKYYHSYANPMFTGTTYTQITLAGDVGNKPTLMLGLGSWGGDGQFADYVHSARTQSVAIGQNYVDLKDPTQHTRFTIGRGGLMTGFVLQLFGYPTNHAFFQVGIITAIDTDSGSLTYGRITFDRVFADRYLDSWPYYGGSSLDDGGPATLYTMPASWLMKVVMSDLIVATENQQDIIAREVELNNVDVLAVQNANNGLFPSFVDLWTVNGGDWTNVTAELDKYVTRAIYNTVQNMQVLVIQSMSTRRVDWNGGSISLILGTPRSLFVDVSADIGEIVTAPAGPYGHTEEIDLRNSNVSTLTPGLSRWLGGFGGDVGINHIPGASLSDGVIRIPKTEGPIAWAVPDFVVFPEEETTRWALPPFRIVSVGENGTDTIITIDPPLSAWPAPPYTGTGVYGIYRHPCLRFTARNMTGDKMFEGLNVARARAPLGSYHKATYVSGVALAAPQRRPFIIGNIVSAKYTMNHVYAGAGALTFSALPFTPYADRNNSHGISPFYTPVVDAKTAGVRTATPNGLSGSGGADSGLAVPDTVQTWLVGGPASDTLQFSSDVSGTDALVSVTVEIKTDQYKVEVPLLCNFT